jgi:hypothetical protein
VREVPGAGCRPPRDPRPVKIAMDTLPPRTAGAVSYIHSPGRQVASGSTCDSFPGRRPDRFIRYEVQQFCTQSCSLRAGLVHVLEPVPESFPEHAAPRACSIARADSMPPSASSLHLYSWRAWAGRASGVTPPSATCTAVRAPLFLRQDGRFSHTPSSRVYAKRLRSPGSWSCQSAVYAQLCYPAIVPCAQSAHGYSVPRSRRGGSAGSCGMARCGFRPPGRILGIRT